MNRLIIFRFCVGWSFANYINYQEKTNYINYQEKKQGFPGGAVVENLPANAGDTGSSPGLGRSHMPWSN